MDKLNGLKITRRLIKEAIPDNSESCPIAMAMQGKVDGIPRVYPKRRLPSKRTRGRRSGSTIPRNYKTGSTSSTRAAMGMPAGRNR